jgi:hypothetical protein
MSLKLFFFVVVVEIGQKTKKVSLLGGGQLASRVGEPPHLSCHAHPHTKLQVDFYFLFNIYV